ncbi:hypothetical protein [Clostridium sp.]
MARIVAIGAYFAEVHDLFSFNNSEMLFIFEPLPQEGHHHPLLVFLSHSA